MLASEFAAPVPADSPPTDTSLNPLPSTGPYEITSYQPTSRIVEQRNPHFQAWRFDGNVPAGNPGSRDVGHRPERIGSRSTAS